MADGANRPDIKAIFGVALERPEGPQRVAYLDAACAGDPALRARVEVLLAAHERASDVLGPGSGGTTADDKTAALGRDKPPPTQAADPDATVDTGPPRPADLDPTIDRTPGDGPEPPPLDRGSVVRYFGDYAILRELGRGGMGIVYEARQVSLNRPVALKMVKAGLLAGDDELRRFQNEAEAVALLDHPGIVPVYEVGELDGQHFFSMKLVPGGSLVPMLAKYRDDPRAAARLVAEAAEAVAHAHARGILHRDLKPANVLVDAEGHPHVTDFGLAKKLEADVEFTQSGAILGTPAYMAPEQATGRRGSITTATDVYGLGALLYALLTGQAPFGGESVVETLDAVRTHPPEPPRKLNAKAPRDLETIALKCLNKDPRRRYPTAQALADDLRAWLDTRPIAARRVGNAERAWLWCRRRPAIAALSAAVALALVGGTFAVIAVQAAANRALAATNAQLATANAQAEERYKLASQAILVFHTGVTEDVLLEEPQFQGLRDRLLNAAIDFYRKLDTLLTKEVIDQSRSRGEVDPHWLLFQSNDHLARLMRTVGRKEDALAAERTLLARREKVAAARAQTARSSADFRDRFNWLMAELEVAKGRASISMLLRDLGRLPEAEAELRRTLKVADKLLVEAKGGDSFVMMKTGTHCDLGDLLLAMGRLADAEAEYRKVLAFQRGDTGLPWQPPAPINVVVPKYPGMPDPGSLTIDIHPRVLGSTYSGLGRALSITGRLDEAEAAYREAAAILRKLVDADKGLQNPDNRLRLATTFWSLAELLWIAGRSSEAEAEIGRAWELAQELARERPAVGAYRGNLAHLRVARCRIVAGTERAPDAEAELREAVALLQDLVAQDPKAAESRESLAGAHEALAFALRRSGRHAEARDASDRSIALNESLIGETPDATTSRGPLAAALTGRALARRHLGDDAGAAADLRRALALSDGLPSRSGAGWFENAGAHAALAGLAGKEGSGLSPERGKAEADAAMELLRKAVEMGFRNPDAFRAADALDPLRSRDDFKALIAELEKSPTP